MAETRRVLHPFDDVDVAAVCSRPRRVGIRRWRAECRAVIAEDAPAAGLQSGRFAQIDLLPYQLEPALALLDGRGARILIADDVGLGKTVQAMLALAELRARGAVRRALIVCPAGLREQWAEECSTRFGMQPTIVDQQVIRRLRSQGAVSVNPWTIEPLVIASIDYVKRADILPAVLAADWDLLVLDEAHGAAGESDRHEAVSRIASRAAYIMLLTATPHSGDEAAFARLCAIGQLDADPLVVFRRTRAEVGRDAGRRSHTLRVRATAPETRMHRALARLTTAVRRDVGEFDRDAWLLLSLLHKRALSSAYALAATTERHLQLLGGDVESVAAQLPLPLDDAMGECDPSDVPPTSTRPLLQDRHRERQLFVELLDAARSACGREGKIGRLRRIIAAVREPVIIFTEYRDTLIDLHNRLGRSSALIHGGMSREQRRQALVRFPELGILLATDAAGEGLNLQGHCRTIVNLELPWNPMRLEQRIGRVDRIGQRRRVHVIHLVAAGTREVLLLERLSSRVSQAQSRVRAANPFGGRPEWSADASARLVVLQSDPEPSRPQLSAPQVPLTRLTHEGEQEARRLALLRDIVGGKTTPPHGRHTVRAAAGRSLLAVAGRWRQRAVLAGRTLSIFKTTLSDGRGRRVSTRIDAVLTTGASAPSGEADVGAGALIAPSQPFSDWLFESTRTHRRMSDVHARRSASILTALQQPRGERQPGLFDQRVEREGQQLDRLHAASVAAARDRIAQVQASAEITSIGPELALVLRPRR